MSEHWLSPDWRTWVKEWINERPGRSQRLIAERLGVSPPSMSAWMRFEPPKRVPPPPHDEKLARMVAGPYADLFLAMMVRDDPPDEEAGIQAAAKVERLRTFHHAVKLDPDDYSFFSHWGHAAILTLATFPGFKDNVSWIRDRLTAPMDDEEIAEILDRLHRMKLLVGRKGRRRAGRHALRDVPTLQDQYRITLRDWHRQLLELSSRSIEVQPRPERAHAAVMRSLTPSQARDVQNRLNTLLQSILGDYGGKPHVRSEVWMAQASMVQLSRRDPNDDATPMDLPASPPPATPVTPPE
jgi:uncharacterized protein (TIGR02147 family)